MNLTARDIIDELNDLTEACKDRQYGFSLCAEHAQAPALRALFGERALDCSRAAAELQAMVAQLGGEPETGGSLASTASRGWTSLRNALVGAEDLTLLDECEHAEDKALAGYRQALKEAFPTRVLALLERQERETRQHHDSLRAERDRLRLAASGA
jgi:uncharacterized protein (TIGR02284 family)